MDNELCPTCHYPSVHNGACTNPACDANPSVPQDVKDARNAEHAKRLAEQAERERIAKIRSEAHWFGTPRYRG